MSEKLNRRDFLGKSMVTAGAATVVSGADLHRVQADKSPETQESESAARSPLCSPQKKASDMPCGMIGNLKLSRMILGSNMMGGHSHSRDLKYVGPLMRAYNTEEKIFETLAMAESVGINTLSQGDHELVQKYNSQHGGNIQQLRPLHMREHDSDEKIKTSIKELVDQGAAAIYIFGHDGDQVVRAGRADRIGVAIDSIKEQGLPAGVGGHSLHVIVECEKEKVDPDFYFKTFHDDKYWSATLEEHRDEYCWYKGASSESGHYNDNMWCMDADATAEFMRDVKAAWIAFKVLAAGAIRPDFGFKFALRHGADFAVVGMFDFQVQQNAKLFKQALARAEDRERPWHGVIA
jgi:hypothetical protein